MSDDVASSRGRIVVGVDGSAPSNDALRWAGRIGAALGLKIDAITSWEFATSYGMGGVPLDYRPDTDAAQVMSEALTAVFGDAVPDGLRSVVREGHPAKILLDASNEAEMLVVGSRGHGGFVGQLLGSVSAPCATHASCPVVVIHPRTDANPT
jgi:nucleotide-binding universal stress UspA family protein